MNDRRGAAAAVALVSLNSYYNNYHSYGLDWGENYVTWRLAAELSDSCT